ncbi:uncharacterized protein [Drosophila takahashii]|uniref:uncharacterized protein n=1 Tax=Drosophila takahashii TaxID=29030 RepID=UPI001CF84B52|nr:uncharacterized protein LOC108058565 [Drosophila takahashii]
MSDWKVRFRQLPLLLLICFALFSDEVIGNLIPNPCQNGQVYANGVCSPIIVNIFNGLCGGQTGIPCNPVNTVVVPGTPGCPNAPVKPVTPACPNAPLNPIVDPATPVVVPGNPACPNAPLKPTVVDPVIPAYPNDPTKPIVVPGTPAYPSDPLDPACPNAPLKPTVVDPVVPVNPDCPNAPLKPTVVDPVTPACPNAPVKPTEVPPSCPNSCPNNCPNNCPNPGSTNCPNNSTPCPTPSTTPAPQPITTPPPNTTPHPKPTPPPDTLLRCPGGTILVRGQCRPLYCGGHGIYTDGRCIQARCPAGYAWTGIRCSKPKPVELGNIHIENTVHQSSGTQPHLTNDNVNNLLINASIAIQGQTSSEEEEDEEEVGNIVVPQPPSGPCCNVFAPRICTTQAAQVGYKCFSRSQQQCGAFCSANKVVLTPPNVTTWTEANSQMLVMPPNWAGQNCQSIGGICQQAQNFYDCSGCALGNISTCSSYCYSYKCSNHNCAYFEQSQYCSLYPGQIGCRAADGWFPSQ